MSQASTKLTINELLQAHERLEKIKQSKSKYQQSKKGKAAQYKANKKYTEKQRTKS